MSNREGAHTPPASLVAGTASASVGAVVAATLGAACCSAPLLGPLIVAVLSVSGAAAFAGIKPYTPYLFGVSLLLLSASFWTVYRPSQRCTVNDGAEPQRVAQKPIRVALWIAAAIWTLAGGFTLFSVTGL
jgi:mercuric ion transport protein